MAGSKMSGAYIRSEDIDTDVSYSGQDLDSSLYSVQMLDSLDASGASSFASHAYHNRPEPQSAVFSTTGYSQPTASSSAPQLRDGVEYLEPRYVEGRTVDAIAPYHAHRVVDLEGGHVQRRQVTMCFCFSFLQREKAYLCTCRPHQVRYATSGRACFDIRKATSGTVVLLSSKFLCRRRAPHTDLSLKNES